MDYIPMVLSLLAVVVGIRGNTWDPARLTGPTKTDPGWWDLTRDQIRGVTLTGWLAFGIAVAAALLAGWNLRNENKERVKFRAGVYQEVDEAANEFLAPYRSLYVEFKGPGFAPSGPMSAASALKLQRERIPADKLVSEEFLSFLGRADVRNDSHVVRRSNLSAASIAAGAKPCPRMPYLDFIAHQFTTASQRMDQAISRNATLLPVNVQNAAQHVLTSPFVKSGVDRPAELRPLDSVTDPRCGTPLVANVKAGHTILPAAGSRHADQIAEYIEFVKKVEALQQLVELQ